MGFEYDSQASGRARTTELRKFDQRGSGFGDWIRREGSENVSRNSEITVEGAMKTHG
jgi:hypothetical protein